MDYNLLKILSPTIPLNRTANFRHSFLRNDPPVDFCNPGIGHLVRLYNEYVPINTSSNPVNKEKIDNLEVSNQEGAGEGDINLSQNGVPHTENKILDKNESNPKGEIKPSLMPSPEVAITPSKSAKHKMDEDISNAFYHPRVKIGKFDTFFKTREDSNKTSALSTTKHKFNVVRKN